MCTSRHLVGDGLGGLEALVDIKYMYNPIIIYI